VCTCPPRMCACAPEISLEMEAEARRWPAHRAAFYDRHPACAHAHMHIHTCVMHNMHNMCMCMCMCMHMCTCTHVHRGYTRTMALLATGIMSLHG